MLLGHTLKWTEPVPQTWRHSLLQPMLLLTTASDDIYAQYNFKGEGNTIVVIDENKSGTVNTGDTLIILSGLSTADGLDGADFM